MLLCILRIRSTSPSCPWVPLLLLPFVLSMVVAYDLSSELTKPLSTASYDGKIQIQNPLVFVWYGTTHRFVKVPLAARSQLSVSKLQSGHHEKRSDASRNHLEN